MGVQVHVDLNLAHLALLLNYLLNGPNSGLVFWTWIQVVAIQILGERVEPVVAAIHAVWVQHRHDFEDKLVAKDLRLAALLVGQELPNACEHERCSSFSGMDTRREENCGLFCKFKRPGGRVTTSLGKKAVYEFFALLGNLLSRRESYHFHRAPFARVVEHLTMNVYVWVPVEPSHQPLCLVERLLEGEGIGPCEKGLVSIVVEVIEGVRKSNSKSILLVTPLQRARTTLPLHRVWLNAVYRAQPHLVQLALLRHSFESKREGLSVSRTVNAEIKPGSVVPHVSVGQTVTIHVACEVIWISVRLDTL